LTDSTVQALTISHAKAKDLTAVLAFHQARTDEYLWPRDYEYFANLIEDRQVFVIKEGFTVVGMGYLVNEGDRWEFGGVYVEERLRARGVASALAYVVISTLYLTDEPNELIAHVHEFNQAPRGALERLGFENTGTQERPPIEPPKSIRRNDNGEVVGDLFRFKRSSLTAFADWLDGFDGTLRGKDGVETPLTILANVWTQRTTLIPALREQADK